MKKIVFTGGGTVGHVTLNLLLMPKFIEEGWEVHYIGDRHGIEYKEIQKSGLPVVFHSIATGKLRRYFSWQNLWDVFKVAGGILQSLGIMLKVRPKALFSKGGFVSVPPVIAAKVTGVPVFIHESDLSLGLANKIGYKCATKMFTTFEQAEGLSKAEHVGAVTKIAALPQTEPAEIEKIKAHFTEGKPTLLFVGGSGGAKVFNDFITKNKDRLIEKYNIINLTGDASLDELSHRIYRLSYVTDLYQPLMAMADVVVTRGGSNTIFELLAMKKLQVIVPLGLGASRGDQIENANYFLEKGYALKINEENLNRVNLQVAVDDLLREKDAYYQRMEKAPELKSVDDFYEILKQDINKGKK